jgi:hypothetical protein
MELRDTLRGLYDDARESERLLKLQKKEEERLEREQLEAEWARMDVIYDQEKRLEAETMFAQLPQLVETAIKRGDPSVVLDMIGLADGAGGQRFRELCEQNNIPLETYHETRCTASGPQEDFQPEFTTFTYLCIPLDKL